jgi:hypothetical protein
MGGTRGEVRAQSKIAAYLEYARVIEDLGQMLPDQDPDPKNKKLCKKRMVQDPNTGDWVLYYHLRT